MINSLAETFNNDRYIKHATELLGKEAPITIKKNRNGFPVIEFYVLNSEFQFWLRGHSDKIFCQFSPKEKDRALHQPSRLGEIVSLFRCHKNGKAPTKPQRSKNTRHSKKSSCPSTITTWTKHMKIVGGDKVEFREVLYKYRHNHLLNVRNLPEMRKSKEMTKRIERMLESGKSVEEVRNELTLCQNEFEEVPLDQLKRDNFVTYDDVKHISEKLIRKKFQKHRFEFNSCELWMGELARQNFFTYTTRDGQCYGFSSPWQLEQLKLFGDVFCFDGTHEVGGYVYAVMLFPGHNDTWQLCLLLLWLFLFIRKKRLLFTIVVKNDHNFGIPVAFLITSRGKSDVIADWLLSLAEKVGNEFNPTVAITDHGSTEIKAINTAFPQCRVFLCIWHVLKAWRTQCRSKGASNDDREKVLL